MPEEPEFKVYGYRWVVLVVFGLVMAVQAFLWLSFAPIEGSVEKALDISSTQVRLLALVGPFMFIIFASFAGSLADRRGWKFCTSIGVVMLVVAGAVKAVFPHLVSDTTVQYWVYLFMQLLGGTGAVFAMVNLSKMPIKWFPGTQRALANGLTTMSMYLGTAIGLPLVTFVAGIPDNARRAEILTDLNRVLLVMGILMGIAAVLYFIFAREEPPTPAGPIPEVESMSLRDSLPRFMRSPAFRALCIVSLAGYGIYIALTVTMEKIIKFHGEGFTAGFASLVASGITVGGIIGAALLPGLSEKVGLRKPFLILAGGVSIPALLIIGFVPSKPLDLLSGVVMGFFLLPALPITFTMVGEMPDIGPRLAATAVGTLLALGSIGSAGVPLLMEVFLRKQNGVSDYRLSIVMLVALGTLALIMVIVNVHETGPKRKGA